MSTSTVPPATVVTAKRRALPATGPWLVILGVAILLRAMPWFKSNAFTGVREYDDGVYYGAATFLLHGQMPYRDVTIVHPPGISLLLTPFAALGDLIGDPAAMALVRVAVLVVALVNMLLIARLTERLTGAGRRAGLVAAAVYAVSPNALASEHTVLLEPLVTVFCLWGLLRLLAGGRTGSLQAGALIAAGTSVKLFAGAYLIAAGCWLLFRGRPRAAVQVLIGYVATLAIIVGPFAAMAPRDMWHDVVVTQLSRPVAATATGLGRVLDMFGLSSAPTLVGLTLLLLVAGFAVHDVVVRRETDLSLMLIVAIVVVAAFLGAATYYPHYGAFLAPALAALTANVAVRSPTPWRHGVALLTASVMFGFLLTQTWHWERDQVGQGQLQALGAQVRPDSCIWYEAASLAIAADVFRPSTTSCSAWVDQRGVLYAESDTSWAHRTDFYYVGFTSNERWQNGIVGQMEQADYLLLKRNPVNIKEWSDATRAYVLMHFRFVRAAEPDTTQSAQLWQRSTT